MVVGSEIISEEINEVGHDNDTVGETMSTEDKGSDGENVDIVEKCGDGGEIVDIENEGVNDCENNESSGGGQEVTVHLDVGVGGERASNQMIKTYGNEKEEVSVRREVGYVGCIVFDRGKFCWWMRCCFGG